MHTDRAACPAKSDRYDKLTLRLQCVTIRDGGTESDIIRSALGSPPAALLTCRLKGRLVPPPRNEFDAFFCSDFTSFSALAREDGGPPAYL